MLIFGKKECLNTLEPVEDINDDCEQYAINFNILREIWQEAQKEIIEEEFK
jgi:hypothetical protein